MIIGFRLTINDPSHPTVTHLQYVDEEHIKNVVVVLGCFEAVSALKVNYSKSAFIGIEVQFLEILATMMGVQSLFFFFF